MINKQNYEVVQHHSDRESYKEYIIDKNDEYVMHIDGHKFSKLRPLLKNTKYDDGVFTSLIIKTFLDTTKEILRNNSQIKMAYYFSDEVSFLVDKIKNPLGCHMYNGRVEKNITSLTSSFTIHFNTFFQNNLNTNIMSKIKNLIFGVNSNETELKNILLEFATHIYVNTFTHNYKREHITCELNAIDYLRERQMMCMTNTINDYFYYLGGSKRDKSKKEERLAFIKNKGVEVKESDLLGYIIFNIKDLIIPEDIKIVEEDGKQKTCIIDFGKQSNVDFFHSLQ